MELMSELWRSVYAVVGAGVRVGEFVRQLPDQLDRAWRDREQWIQSLGEVYDDLAEQGEAALGGAQSTLQQQAREAGQKARQVPGVAAAEGEMTGLLAKEGELPINDYGRLSADEISARLPALSQRELHQVEGYETRTKARSTVLSRVDELRGAEPWSGYDEMAVDEILPRLRRLSPSKQAEVAKHEQRHKQRRTILAATRH